MSQMHLRAAEQIVQTYAQMADEARYRPGAPSDGFGHIVTGDDWLDAQKEALGYAKAWWKEEDAGAYQVGCPSFENRPALILAIEAARLIAAGDTGRAARLMELSQQHLTPMEPAS